MNKQKYYNDYIDLEKERLNKYITTSEKDLTDLSNFLSEFYSSGLLFHKSISKKLSTIFDITKISEVTTKIDQNMKFFYQTSQLFINSIQVFLDKLNLALILPLKEFKLNYEKKNKEIKKNFEKISNDYKTIKQKVIISQQKYYAKEQEYFKIKSEMNLKKLKNNFKDKDQDNLYMAKTKSINEKEIYKYQTQSANIFYKNFDFLYQKNCKNFEISEENKFVFLNNLFSMYCNNMKDLGVYINDYCGQIDSKFAGWKLDDDKKIIKDEFNCLGRYIIYPDKEKNVVDKKKSESNERFNKECFKILNNINIKYVNDYFDIVENNRKIGFFFKNKIFGYIIDSKTNSEEVINYKDYDILSNDYQKKIMKVFFDNLDSQNELSPDIISSIIELLLNDKKFPQYFIKDYYVTHNTSYIRMLNEKNLEHFGNILSTILLINEMDKADLLNIMIKIIYYGERVYYLIPDAENKKMFLCGYLNKIPLFKCIYFWESTIKYKLAYRLEKLSRDIDEKFEILNKTNKKHNNNINHNNSEYSNNSNYYDTGMNIYEELNTTDDSVDSFKSYKKNIYSKSKNKDNKSNESNLLISIINYEESFEELTNELKNEFVKKGYNIFNDIIIEYLPAFVNYNFGLNNSLDLLVKICNEFSMSNDMINYYAIYLNNCAYSVKQYSKNSFYDLKNKIEDIRVVSKLNSAKKINQIKFNINLQQEKKVLNDTEKMIIIKKVSRFLPDKDKINILKLNKKFSSKLNKKIYKEILNRKDIEIGIIPNKQMHLNIWKILLKYKEIKKLYPYYPNFEKAKKVEYDMSGKNDFCVIDLDTQRTLFEPKNIEEKRKSLNNILKTCVMLNGQGCYCQGMNFVAAFILKISENEEDSFYYLMGLFKHTDYRSIFIKDLTKLRIYFSVFEEILKLYIPTLESYFEDNKVRANYYLSAWFIALFTSLVKQGNKLDAFLKIFDLFIIDGWKAIFNISMDILRKNEEILLTLKNEGLFHYLTSVLGNDFVLNKENYGYLLNNNINKRLILRISGKLIHNVENQVNQTEKLNEKNE